MNEVDILAIFVSMSWFGFEFWFWIFWIYAWICAIVLLILCLRFNGFMFLSLFCCVSELVLLCSLNGFSVRFGLVLLNERRFMGLCSYILEHVVVVLWVCCVLFWIFWVCVWFWIFLVWILNFLGEKNPELKKKKKKILLPCFKNTAIGGFSRFFKMQPKLHL